MNDTPAQLHDILPPIAPLVIPWLLWGLSALALIGLLALSLFWQRRASARAKAAQIVSPLDVARQEFARLREQGLEDRAFAYALTDIVRRYAETTFKLPVTERTTEEMLEALRAQPPFSQGLAQKLGHLLQSTVLVRYAAQPLAPEQRQALLDEGSQWVEVADHERAARLAAAQAATTTSPRPTSGQSAA